MFSLAFTLKSAVTDDHYNWAESAAQSIPEKVDFSGSYSRGFNPLDFF